MLCDTSVWLLTPRGRHTVTPKSIALSESQNIGLPVLQPKNYGSIDERGHRGSLVDEGILGRGAALNEK